MLKKAIFVAFFSLSYMAIACEDCKKAFLDIGKIEKSIHRLESILRANEDFIAGLDPSDESELIKARSNVSIAKKRILASETQKQTLQPALETPFCKKCLTGDKI